MSSTFRPVILGLGLLALVAGCTTLKYDVRGGRDPGAELHIVAEVKRDQFRTRLLFRAENLSPPERILDGGQAYVLWARRNSETPWTRLGALEYQPGSRQGSLETTYKDVRFEVVLTAERGDQPPSPSADVMFAQRVQR
jgi:hypothetical protein